MKRPYRIRRVDADRRPSLFREEPSEPSRFARMIGDLALVTFILWLAVGIAVAWAQGRLG